MSSSSHHVQLAGCSPTPLARYLKALGVFRNVAEQVDREAEGWWQHDSFWVRSTLDANELVDFFLNRYEPTPIVSPWNGGSGFHLKDNKAGIGPIRAGDATRFARYREVIHECESILSFASRELEKESLLQLCRNRLPDDALSWLDAAFVLTSSGPKYPPLLGTGGNDGRLEFTNNFMQHLIGLIDPTDGTPSGQATVQLGECLFADVSNCRRRGAIGQFDPGNLGGANNGSGFDGSSTVNSWDYVLMLEGAIAFAAASTKRLETKGIGSLAYPFCVRSTGVGYGSSDASDEALSRAEMWLPIWTCQASFRAVTRLLSEGRVETQGRRARNGVDFARAIASLGVDRGITEFQRFGFQQRNGLAYLAVPLGRFSVKARPRVDELLAPLDKWIDRFRRAATGKNAPERAGRASRKLDATMFKLCQRGRQADVEATLIALGEAEASVAISKQMRDGSMGSGISPLPQLSGQWLLDAYDGSPEFRLAASLASIDSRAVGPFRRHLEPFDWTAGFPRWKENADDPAIVWHSGSLTKNLCGVLNRRLIDVQKPSNEDPGGTPRLAPLGGQLCASLVDIVMFQNAVVDEERIESLFRALCLLNFRSRTQSGEDSPLTATAARLANADELEKSDAMLLGLLQGFLPFDKFDHSLFAKAMKHVRAATTRSALPDATYGQLKLCFLPYKLNGESVVLKPQIVRRAMAGEISDALQLAAQRLQGSGFISAADVTTCGLERAMRTAASLMFPIHRRDAQKLADRVLRNNQDEDRLASVSAGKLEGEESQHEL